MWGGLTGGATDAVASTTSAAYQSVFVNLLQCSIIWGEVARGVTDRAVVFMKALSIYYFVPPRRKQLLFRLL